jgi:hypothetical protein
MGKTSTVSRRKSTITDINTTTKSPTKASPNKANKNHSKRTTTSTPTGKNPVDTKVTPVSPTPTKLGRTLTYTEDKLHHFGITINDQDEHVLLAPLSVPLTEVFLTHNKRYREAIQPYSFIDRSSGMEEDKEIDLRIKRGFKMLKLNDPSTEDWYKLFALSYSSKEPESNKTDEGAEMREFGLHLAASDPLTLFDYKEFDGEGNLFPCRLAFAWISATSLLGSIHLFYDIQLQKNRINALTYEDMHEDQDDYEVPSEGLPRYTWNDLPDREKQNCKAFTYPQRLGEDQQDRCIADMCFTYHNFFKIEELDMSVDKWSNAFIDASTPGSLIFPMSIGKQIRSFGIDLAITHPAELFMEHEWIKRTHLRPQLHAHAWLGAIKAFGALFTIMTASAKQLSTQCTCRKNRKWEAKIILTRKPKLPKSRRW